MMRSLGSLLDAGVAEATVKRDPLAWIKQKAAEVAEQAEQRAANEPRQMFLPGFDIGAFPNHLNRSSLIAPIARGKRKFHRQAVMVTRRDCVLEYTGEQLDEADGDLIMALIAFAQPFPLGTPVPLNRKKLLRKIKPGSIGSTQYDWLYRSMKRLREGILFLEARKPDGSTRYTVGKMESFNILKGLNYDGESETYTYILDPRWVVMFGNREYSLIDWDKRMQIGRGLDMAKTLQRLIATSANPVQWYALDGLKAQMEYSGRMRDFRDALTRAVRELERLGIIAKGCIEDSTKGKPQLAMWLPPSG
ncbi:TPA: plasmid replication initiator TrfA [Pseudomonas aeruginosa]|uniref:plasmid replication initiator TrfA n=1 Tax=Pseudomonas aeruginosa TaxID=287 RepID=UPI0021D95873|nr:plasmid replication initiator TrfA [Pseudomonas aeruginosa]MDI3572499.1 plasmid replication initiator TrfA [Pseudomonas aeruginosa]MDI3590866.1 plasmid replication initiator TrfA [Pseudomonas aeruginosa]MDI3773567.1 plasmid replication initiator TrfA [Pseudomonas aeruginosa]MDI3804157.1 plasmid replication initiator TrfA [Pseudomonas aeruginosa]